MYLNKNYFVILIVLIMNNVNWRHGDDNFITARNKMTVRHSSYNLPCSGVAGTTTDNFYNIRDVLNIITNSGGIVSSY